MHKLFQSPPPCSKSLGQLWHAALACFVLAAVTGTLFRVGATGAGLPLGLDFGNVRRAHSHLMFFSWVSPALMALIAARLARRFGRSWGRPMRLVIGANLALGLASFVPFLLDGYQSTAVFGANIPLSIILSTASIFAWYAFAWLYQKRTRGLQRTTAVALWDVAVVALIVSSLGTWARGAFMGMQVEDPLLTHGSVHFFLGLFSDGWLGLAALGLLHDYLGVEMRGSKRWWTALLVAGLPITFVLGIPSHIVPSSLGSLAAVGGLMVGAGFAAHAVILWRHSRRSGQLWGAALACVGLKAGAQLLFVVPSIAAWAEAAGLRILYLHVLFLGFVTLALVESARLCWGNVERAHTRWMQAAVAILLVTMLPTTGLWPSSWTGHGSLWLTAVGSLAPTAVALWILVSRSRSDMSRVESMDPSPHRSPVDHRPDASPSRSTPPRPRGRVLVDRTR